ncbi:DUF4124 domain-containing protein [Marinobacter sp. chi1]|uniref:DUF4124 domain-containing protein n=1 Tax=Marinobacter suaedae TaxID=3057675 RepID=A0ABT8VXF0_9GAMM|nr:DUF4124 domain-containing protein [Marinobacter sp. chi1]MDO3720608.1 DUF4124 domain-containing protein [Marinobacter sp. chi1]
MDLVFALQVIVTGFLISFFAPSVARKQSLSRSSLAPVVLFVLCFGEAEIAQAAVYKCVGEDGELMFTDRPCPSARVTDNVVDVTPPGASTKSETRLTRTDSTSRAPSNTQTSMSWKAKCTFENGKTECAEVQPDVPDVGTLNCEQATRRAHQWINPRIESRLVNSNSNDGPDYLLDTYRQMKVDTSFSRCQKATGLSRRFFQCLDTPDSWLPACIQEFPRM